MKSNAAYSLFCMLCLCGALLSCQSTALKTQASLPAAPAAELNIPNPTPPAFEENSPLNVSYDQGKSWTSIGKDLPENSQIVHIEKVGNQLLLATYKNGLYIGNKNDWKSIGSNLPEAQINDLYVVGDNLYASIYEQGIHRSQDQGKTWLSLNYNLPDLRVQSILDVAGRLIVGTDSGVYEYYEETHFWGKLFDGAQINSLVREGNKIVAATHKGVLLSSDLGKNWQWIHEEGAVSKCYLLDGQIAELNMSGQYYFSNDWGKSWLQTMRMPKNRSTNFDLVKDGNVLIMSNRFGILHSYDGGLSWEIVLEIENSTIQELYLDGKILYAGNWSMGNC